MKDLSLLNELLILYAVISGIDIVVLNFAMKNLPFEEGVEGPEIITFMMWASLFPIANVVVLIMLIGSFLKTVRYWITGKDDDQD